MRSAFGPSPLSGVKVLVAEDDDEVREAYTALFELFGAIVTAAASGNAAWQTFRASRPDVLISDIQMPDGDGYELIRRIRALPPEQGSLTPAIAVSGSQGPEQSLGAGFHAHIRKPADALALVELVRRFVREGTETRSAWTLSSSDPTIALLTFVGHPTAEDMRLATRSLVTLLESSDRHVVVDLRQITGFDLSVGSVAERTVWEVRHRITGATIVDGSFLARLVAKAACAALGVSCAFVEDWPVRARANATPVE